MLGQAAALTLPFAASAAGSNDGSAQGPQQPKLDEEEKPEHGQQAEQMGERTEESVDC